MAPASAGAQGCRSQQLATSDGCTSQAAAGRKVAALTRAAYEEGGMRAAIVRVDAGTRRLTTTALGESMAGVRASPRMHFRIGAMAIPHLITVLLQLQDERRLSLDDPLARWFPAYPNARRITLRMLANGTSGYPDWIQGNQEFVGAFYANVFRQWTPDELIRVALDRPLVCEPGACFHYSHTGYAILSKVLRAVTGRPVDRLVYERVLRPLGLRETRISAEPAIPEPALHAYGTDRGPYEDSTYWSPSWTLGSGSIMTAAIGDVARTARAVGTGRLLSRRAARERVAPPAGLPRADAYFGLGIVVSGDWLVQNPVLNGYTGIMAYLPPEDLTVAVTATNGEQAARADANNSTALFEKIAAYLAPGHPAPSPG